MSNATKRIELANEAIELIKEFRNEEAKLGMEMLISVKASEDGKIIIVNNDLEGETEWELSEISSEFARDMEGFGMFGAGLYEEIDELVSSFQYKYGEMDKEEFIQYVGNIYYIKYRCEEIYNRLKEIEKESEQLEG